LANLRKPRIEAIAHDWLDASTKSFPSLEQGEQASHRENQFVH
jgi:hypothetical protein